MEGWIKKFTVLKDEDIEKYCSPILQDKLRDVCEAIANGRIGDGKHTANTYLVINTDEPYANEIVKILKRNGHWG